MSGEKPNRSVDQTEYIKKLVDAAPPLTEAQKTKLRALLAPLASRL